MILNDKLNLQVSTIFMHPRSIHVEALRIAHESHEKYENLEKNPNSLKNCRNIEITVEISKKKFIYEHNLVFICQKSIFFREKIVFFDNFRDNCIKKIIKIFVKPNFFLLKTKLNKMIQPLQTSKYIFHFSKP
jgi:hypothetical protein